MKLDEAKALLQQTRAKADAALTRASSQAYAAGRNMARAMNATGNLRDQAQAALLARDAYWQRIGAEGEKFRATYLLLAARERETAAQAAASAANVKNAREQRHIIERAQSYAMRANILEQAADRAADAVKNVAEPEVVSLRRAQRLATAMGVDTREVNTAPTVAARMSPLLTRKMYNPLMDWIYPADIKRAAGGLAGVGEAGITPGDGTAGESFADSLKRALGIGVSEAGKAATKAGQDAAKENPGTAVLASTAGGLLAAIAQTLGVSYNGGYSAGQNTTPAGDWKISWGAVAAAVVVVGAGYMVWRNA